ncbi:hypothetical protein IFM89_031121 [Coptis chinensis]|uniref:DUF8039 domain-containing protein n=1 Tax=Coptis chinensis TaxID=261450 RepID=A0A835IVF9_9MAGN|nr:hypothetical protein IFM89_031121 [Coptis chinensis]
MHVKDAGIPKTKKTPTNHEFSTPKVIKCSLALRSKVNIVAKGLLFKKTGPEEKVHNIPLGEHNGVKCSLALTLKSNIVAKGLVFKNTRPQEKINDIPLGEANYRVQIDTVIKPGLLLPVPVGDLRFVKDAWHSFVAWPKEFVIIISTM